MLVAGAAEAEGWDPCADNPCPEHSRCKPKSGGWICIDPENTGGTEISVPPDVQRRKAIAQLTVGYILLAPGLAFTATGIWLAAPPHKFMTLGFAVALYGLMNLSASIPLIVMGHTRYRQYILSQQARTTMVTPFVIPTHDGVMAGLSGRF